MKQARLSFGIAATKDSSRSPANAKAGLQGSVEQTDQSAPPAKRVRLERERLRSEGPNTKEVLGSAIKADQQAPLHEPVSATYPKESPSDSELGNKSTQQASSSDSQEVIVIELSRDSFESGGTCVAPEKSSDSAKFSPGLTSAPLTENLVGDTGKDDSSSRTATVKKNLPSKRKLSKLDKVSEKKIDRRSKEYRMTNPARVREKEEADKRREQERIRREREKLERKEEKDKKKLEKERKKEEERLEKERKKQEERLEKERKKEEERLEKERERIEKEKVRKEKERKKEEERLEKERDREEKEKQRREKEEERQRREEEKRREAEEDIARKEKAKQAFMSFFKKSGGAGSDGPVLAPASAATSPALSPSRGVGDPAQSKIFIDGSSAGRLNSAGSNWSQNTALQTRFKPFQLKKDMWLASVVPNKSRQRFDRDQFERILGIAESNSSAEKSDLHESLEEVDVTYKITSALPANELYLSLLRRKEYRPLSVSKTAIREEQRRRHNRLSGDVPSAGIAVAPNSETSGNLCRQTTIGDDDMDDEDEDDSVTVVICSYTAGTGRGGTLSSRDEAGKLSDRHVRVKLLQFVENYRPAYYGTWRKRCPQICGRRPFGRFEDFDYSVDSDDEWEEVEGDVESLADTDDEKDKEDGHLDDDYEEDDFIVPHGYLSESEEDDYDDEKPLDPEAFKARIEARQEEFKAELKKPLKKRKAVVVCTIRQDGSTLEAEAALLQPFRTYILLASHESPLKPTWEQDMDPINVFSSAKDFEPKMLSGEALRVFCEVAHGYQGGVRDFYEAFNNKWKLQSDVKVPLKDLKCTFTAVASKKNNVFVVNREYVEKFDLKGADVLLIEEQATTPSLKLLPDDVIPQLIRIAHGSSNTNQVIVDFLNQSKHSNIYSKGQVKRTLRSIATFDHVKSCWLVRSKVLADYDLEDLSAKIVHEGKHKDKKDRKNVEETNIFKEFGKNLKNASSKKDHEETSEVVDLSVDLKSNEDLKGKENLSSETTPKVVSIKNFFSAAKVTDSPNMPSDCAKSSENETPKPKKRIQLITLSQSFAAKKVSERQDTSSSKEVKPSDESG